MSEVAAERTLVGWREWLALPEFGLASIKAKFDTGARSSSLHVERWEMFERNGARWVRFELKRSRRAARELRVEALLVDTRVVTDSGGDRAMRPFVRTELRVGGASWPIEVNLTNRKAMLFPLLIGRTAMAGRIVVDPSRSFALGRPKRKARSR